MQKEEFIAYLSNPAELNEKSLDNLREILKDYPYFQAAHLLMVKNLSNLNHLKFDSQLRLSAAYVGNRKLLFRLLSETSGISKNIMAETVPTGKAEPVVVPEVTAVQPEKSPEVITKEKSIADIVLEQVAEMKQALSQPVEEKKKPEQTTVDTKAGGDIFEIDDKQEITEGKVPAEQLQETKSKPDLLVIEDQSGSNEVPLTVQKKEKIVSKKSSAKSTQKKTPLEKEIDLYESHSFTSWLSLFRDDEYKLPDTGYSPSNKKNELIDAFITNPPRMERPSMITTGDEVVDISRNSVMESDDFITETLAKIYLKQKKYDKAISSYEKLSLKYPEKVSYFADQIEEIRRLITSTNS